MCLLISVRFPNVNLEEDLIHEDSNELVYLCVNGNSFQVKSSDDYSSIIGQLRRALKFCIDIHTPQFNLDVVEYG